MTNRLPFFDLRDWWLSNARVAELLRYGPGLQYSADTKPFYPASQQPETKFPFVRYGMVRHHDTQQWWMQTDSIAMDVFMYDIMDSTELLNELVGMAGRKDRSARDLEQWIVGQGRERAFAYHSIDFAGGYDMGAPNEEGAHHARPLMFHILFSPLTALNVR
jgi:hypothetical protein